MATLDSGGRPRHGLPSISHLDLKKITTEGADTTRFPSMTGLNIMPGPLASPNTVYSGPPPPYSSISSAPGSASQTPGYASPPETITRRSTLNEKESPVSNKTLPSIHEALGDRSIMTAPPSANPSRTPDQVAHPSISSFPDTLRGPSNPLSTGSSIPAPLPEASHPHTQHDLASSRQQPFASTLPRVPGPSTHPFPFPSSPPRSTPRLSLPDSTTSLLAQPTRAAHGGLEALDETRVKAPVPPQDGHATAPSRPPVCTTFDVNTGARYDESRNPFARQPLSLPYGETVKRHLDIYDAEMALHEISEASSRTLEFSRFWAQRYHHSNRTRSFPESMPNMLEIDEIMRQSQCVIENLNRLRDAVTTQQDAIREEHARMVAAHPASDEYPASEDYKRGGFAGGDAKKRRGKAAPPGRCHSCNRAETPEWRRGPDGARTLCNACGLHYAKLTRKMGANKAGTVTGSSLRPKSLDATRS